MHTTSCCEASNFLFRTNSSLFCIFSGKLHMAACHADFLHTEGLARHSLHLTVRVMQTALGFLRVDEKSQFIQNRLTCVEAKRLQCVCMG